MLTTSTKEATSSVLKAAGVSGVAARSSAIWVIAMPRRSLLVSDQRKPVGCDGRALSGACP